MVSISVWNQEMIRCPDSCATPSPTVIWCWKGGGSPAAEVGTYSAVKFKRTASLSQLGSDLVSGMVKGLIVRRFKSWQSGFWKQAQSLRDGGSESSTRYFLPQPLPTSRKQDPGRRKALDSIEDTIRQAGNTPPENDFVPPFA
jgi:hypothetical protein